MDYAGAERAGMCCALALNFDNFDATDTFQFHTTATSPVANGVPLFYDPGIDAQVIGITQDFSTYYPLSAISTAPSLVTAQAAGFAGNFNSATKIYLAFLDQYSQWHTAYNACVYSP